MELMGPPTPGRSLQLYKVDTPGQVVSGQLKCTIHDRLQTSHLVAVGGLVLQYASLGSDRSLYHCDDEWADCVCS
jgi:hypothetical protein